MTRWNRDSWRAHGFGGATVHLQTDSKVAPGRGACPPARLYKLHCQGDRWVQLASTARTTTARGLVTCPSCCTLEANDV